MRIAYETKRFGPEIRHVIGQVNRRNARTMAVSCCDWRPSAGMLLRGCSNHEL